MGFDQNTTTPTLVLFCGLPGSGKTTTARQLEMRTNAVRLCTDEWLADLEIDLFDEGTRDKLQASLYEHAKVLLRYGCDVILEDGLWTRQERDKKRREALEIGANTELHYFDLSFEELWHRLRGRNMHAGYGTVPITKRQLESYWPKFEKPNQAELALFDCCIIHT